MLLVSAAVAALLSASAPQERPPVARQESTSNVAPALFPKPPPAGPIFKLINYDEDWSYLRAPEKRTSIWSDLKYVPLGDQSWLSIGGEARWRAEYRGHERFGRGLQDDNGDLQQRLRLWGDLHLTPNLRAFVDIQDARSVGLDSGTPITEESHADFHQAFIEGSLPVGDANVRLRVGRQEFGVGAFRLFEMREGTNTRVALDLARLMVDRPTGWSGGVFGGYAVRESKASWDDATNYDYKLYGGMASRALGEGPTAPRLELFYVNTDRKGIAFDTGVAGRDDRNTYSVRVFGRRGSYDYDVEGVLQRGDFRGLDARAWYVSATGGKTFDHPWSPRVAVRFDAASGDKDRNDNKLNTYNQLYVPAVSLRTDFGVSNMVLVQPQVTFKPTQKLLVGLQTAGLWRESKDDGVYLLSGQVLRSATEGAASHVGWRYAAWASYPLNPFVTLTGIANYTQAGKFLKQSGARDQSYAGLVLGVKF